MAKTSVDSPLFERYQIQQFFDEMFDEAGQVRPPYLALAQRLSLLSP